LAGSADLIAFLRALTGEPITFEDAEIFELVKTD